MNVCWPALTGLVRSTVIGAKPLVPGLNVPTTEPSTTMAITPVPPDAWRVCTTTWSTCWFGLMEIEAAALVVAPELQRIMDTPPAPVKGATCELDSLMDSAWLGLPTMAPEAAPAASTCAYRANMRPRKAPKRNNAGVYSS